MARGESGRRAASQVASAASASFLLRLTSAFTSLSLNGWNREFTKDLAEKSLGEQGKIRSKAAPLAGIGKVISGAIILTFRCARRRKRGIHRRLNRVIRQTAKLVWQVA
jgi:hypothetical protein